MSKLSENCVNNPEKEKTVHVIVFTLCYIHICSQTEGKKQEKNAETQ